MGTAPVPARAIATCSGPTRRRTAATSTCGYPPASPQAHSKSANRRGTFLAHARYFTEMFEVVERLEICARTTAFGRIVQASARERAHMAARFSS
eukprot:6193381-Pleurochrysis_carterae.AAC.3